LAGIYIHIPFCRKACVYCDFHFLTSLKQKEAMVDALVQEIQLRKDFFGHQEPLQTLYFGGGTPSVLSREELARLMRALHDHFSFRQDAEITLEANPDDLNRGYLTDLQELGFNRLSIGIQSFREQDLRWMNRSHNRQQALDCTQQAAETGFENISIDLIFGLPQLGIAEWESHLQQAVSLPIQHLSLYALTVEAQTALAHQVRQNEALIPDDPVFAQQFLWAHQYLEAHGFEHYELSNYARAGFRSRHNSAYWQGVSYLGLGPSAHSYDGRQRSWNLAHNAHYIKQLNLNQSPIKSSEVLDAMSRYHEYIMTHLRKKEGIDPVRIEREFIPDWKKRFGTYLAELKDKGWMYEGGAGLALSPEGWLVSDGIIEGFFLS
jgi:putative oxygen-independent coproporphyrinogen III oxidase